MPSISRPCPPQRPIRPWWVMLLSIACAPASPFEGPGYDPDRGLTTDAPGPYVAVVTEAVVSSDGHDLFDQHVEQIEDDLADRPGLVGVSLRGEVFGDTRWTLSVWEDEAALGAFLGGQAHGAAMGAAHRSTDRVRSARWTVSRAQVPPDWDAAIERLDGAEAY